MTKPREKPVSRPSSYTNGGADPTANVRELFDAGSIRQDDLLAAERRYNDLREEHQKAMACLREKHQKEISEKESNRLDSIRQVDREEVAKTAASANLAISTLAKQTTDLASTLQASVQATAQAAETRRSADMSEANKRISALELASSASAGKQQVADPAQAEMFKAITSGMEKMGEKIGSLDLSRGTIKGGDDKSKAIWVWVVGAVGMTLGLLSFAERVLGP